MDNNKNKLNNQELKQNKNCQSSTTGLLKPKLIIVLAITGLALFGFPKASQALDVEANSCSRSDVEVAISTVKNAGGGTVHIPAGDCNWDGKGSSGSTVQGNVSIMGAGIGNTILRVTDGSTFFYYATGGTSTFWRLSGITFYSDLGCTTSCQTSNGIEIRNTQNFRIDHNHFEGYFGALIQPKSITKGLIDHNTIINLNISEAGSRYGITAGQAYDGGPPNPQCHTVGDPNCLPRCNTQVCSCEAGEPSSDRSFSVASGNTVISSVAAVINNSGGSGTGKVRRIYINIASANPGATVNVASFSRSGNVFTARARTTGLVVKPGLNIFAVDDNEFTAFNINNGDYVGVYLNAGTLEASSGSTGWTVSGDKTNQSNTDFGNPDIGAISLYAELYDNENAFASCEQSWINWYNDTTRGGGYYVPFNRNWTYDENAIYIEDNTITYYANHVNTNWGATQKMIVRHNTFYSPNGKVVTWSKPGSNYVIWHDNIFEYTGGGSAGYVSWVNNDSLYYKNTFRNFNNGASYEAYRNYSDYYFPFYVRPKEIYVWGNTYEGASCGTTDSACWYSANEGTFWMNQPGENGAIHFRAPQQGERLYGFTEYTYPHPLTLGDSGDTTPPSAPQGLTVE